MRPRASLGLAPSLPGIILVVVIFWALAAVMMLTGTLINAREIDDDVEVITGEVSPIDKDLDNVKLARETIRISGEIDAAAANLSTILNEVLAAARSIDRNAKGILVTAGAINQTAGVINRNVKSINATVSQIHGRVVSIHGLVESIGASVASISGRVNSIGGHVASIGGSVRSIGGRATSINASARSILRSFQGIDPETRTIDAGVAAINGRADRAIAGARGIEDDLSAVLVQVGAGSPAGHGTANNASIHGHANSIDCAALGSYCGQ